MKFTETCKLVYNMHGFTGFGRGYWCTFNRDVWGFALYFWAYHYLKDFGTERNILSEFYLLMIGGVAGNYHNIKI